MHRVLRPGGGYALLWNDWDDDDPLMHALDELVDALRPERRTDDDRRTGGGARRLAALRRPGGADTSRIASDSTPTRSSSASRR